MRTHRTHPVVLVLAAALAALAGRSAAAEVGQVLDDAKLREIGGGTAALFERGSSATVLVFLRPEQERSQETLRVIARVQSSLAGKPVRWVGIAAADAVPADVKAMLAAAGSTLPVLLDEGDALYARLGVRTHPAILFLDKGRRVLAFEPFHPVGFADILNARVRRALGEIGDAEVAKALAPAESQMPGEDPIGVARRHVSFGRKLLVGKAFAKAHENARKSLEIAPTAAAWALEGQIFAAEGNCAEAAKAFDSALRLDAKEPAALAGRGACPR